MPTDTIDPNTTAEQEVQDTPEQEQAAQDTFDSLPMGGKTFQIRSTITAKKGKGGGKLLILFEPPKNPDGTLNFASLLSDLRSAVGEANWDKTLYAEFVRPMCQDATTEAVNQATDGIPSHEGFAHAISSWVVPGSRRKENVKDLRERTIAIYDELMPYLTRACAVEGDGLEPLTEKERLVVMQRMAEYTELKNKLEQKTKKGTARKGK